MEKIDATFAKDFGFELEDHGTWFALYTTSDPIIMYSASENGHVVQENRSACPLRIGHVQRRFIHGFRPLHPQ